MKVIKVLAEEITYYALRETDEPEATGLFRDRRIPGSTTYLERLDRSGSWVRDNSLVDYLMGELGAEAVSEVESAMVAQRLGGTGPRLCGLPRT